MNRFLLLKKNEKGSFQLGARGQLYSTDALLALVIFAFALVMVSVLTTQLQVQAVQSSAQESIRLSAVRVSTTLLSSSGNPVFWEVLSDRNGVKSVGLIGAGSAIENDKWAAFLDYNADDYTHLKSVMGIGDQEFYLTMVDVNRIVMSQAGISPVDVNTIALVTLPSVYQGKPVFVNVQVYQP